MGFDRPRRVRARPARRPRRRPRRSPRAARAGSEVAPTCRRAPGRRTARARRGTRRSARRRATPSAAPGDGSTRSLALADPDDRRPGSWCSPPAGPDPEPPPAAPVESLELFAAQAGASLHNAQVHRGLEELKDRLDHEASHDPLTELANRRRFTDELERTAAPGPPRRPPRRALPRPRRVQGRERPLRPRRRQRPARRGRDPAARTASGPATSSPAWAATSSRSC